jgi:hypothetical protein
VWGADRFKILLCNKGDNSEFPGFLQGNCARLVAAESSMILAAQPLQENDVLLNYQRIGIGPLLMQDCPTSLTEMPLLHLIVAASESSLGVDGPRIAAERAFHVKNAP